MIAIMVVWGSESYWLVRFLFQRGLALIYLLAFLVAVNQFRPLAGENGLLPLDRFLESRSFSDRPSLFHYVPSDRAIGLSAWTGVSLSIAALLAVPYWLPDPLPIPASMLIWAVLWLLYLSFVNAGQLFYGYGWESMLLETGFLAIFLGAGSSAPPIVIIWLLKWLLFRNMFGAGLIKIRGDECWRDLTCLHHHYETQPMPNPLSWFAHHLPDPFHRLEVLGNHIVELAIPFLYFAPQPFAAIGGFATVAFQSWLLLTGNFSWLNALTIVQSTVIFTDDLFAPVLQTASVSVAAPPTALVGLSVIVGLIVLTLSVRPTLNMLSSTQVMNTSFDPLNLVNTYGAFGSITKRRFQLVIEGTREQNPDESDWKAYDFKGQPVRLDDRPPQWAPYHLRLDWQLWFAAMRPQPGPRQRWLFAYLEALFENDEAVCSLIRTNPFSEQPPTKLRILRYQYHFSTPSERAESGQWWTRDRLGTYLGPVTASTLSNELGTTIIRR